MSIKRVAVISFSLSLLLIAAASCKEQEDHHRITARLDADGYALFEVDPNTPGRAAALVEMRDAPAGTYVLLHSTKSPTSVGWFALDVAEYKACRDGGYTTLDCVVPDGRGEVVDIVTVAAEPRVEPTDTTLLRHELAAVTLAKAPKPSTPTSSSLPPAPSSAIASQPPVSTSPSFARASEYYAVMRLDRALPKPDLFAFEVRQLDVVASTDTSTPSVKQLH